MQPARDARQLLDTTLIVGETRVEAHKDPRGTLYLENPQKSDHGPPPEGCHGLALPNPSRAAFIGGVSSGKTCCILNTVARCHAWQPFDGGIYLMSPNNEAVRNGEYGIIDDITCLGGATAARLSRV